MESESVIDLSDNDRRSGEKVSCLGDLDEDGPTGGEAVPPEDDP